MATDAERTAAFTKERRAQLRAMTERRRDDHARLVELLNNAREQIRLILAGAPTDYQLWSLPQLEAAIAAALAELGNQSAVLVGAGIEASWQQGLDLVDAPLAAGGVDLSAILPRVDTAQLEGLRALTVQLIKKLPAETLAKIGSEIGLTVVGAQSVGQTVARVSELVDGNRSRALTIVRTEYGRAAATATQARMEQAAQVLPELKKQWRRSGKPRSRPRHDAIDGQVRGIDEPFVLPNGVELLYPREPTAPAAETINCGCESLPYMDGWPMSQPGARPYSGEEKLRRGDYSDAREPLAPGWANEQ
jgi:uncharacterized protein with gpF-like domain